MITQRHARADVAALLLLIPALAPAGPAHHGRAALQHIVDAGMRPLMHKHGIPGMAVGVILDSKPHVFDYGVASLASRAPLTHSSRTAVHTGPMRVIRMPSGHVSFDAYNGGST